MNPDSAEQQIIAYQALVQRYEQLDADIRALLGGQDRARAYQLPQYRELARERDELFSEIRALEQVLRLEE